MNSYERIEKDEQVADVRHIDWYDYVDKEHDIDTVNKDDQYDIIIGSDLVNWEDDVGKCRCKVIFELRNIILRTSKFYSTFSIFECRSFDCNFEVFFVGQERIHGNYFFVE